MVIQKMHSEGSQLTVPELAGAQCYITFPPPFDLSAMRQFLQQQVERFAHAYTLPELPELDWSGYMVEPVKAETQEIERVLQQSAARLGMAPIDVGPSTGTSDMRHFAEAGIPCLLYGPGAGFNPHRSDEHYYLDDLPRMILFYLHTVHAWCGGEAR
jgi:acetylornithine deacetylase/succinyl-diaminopimelate desuccinylase-like protein